MTYKVFIQTHGCQMNVADSNTILDSLTQSFDIEQVNDINLADILVMNTCSVREKPQEKVFSELGRWKKVKEKKPSVIIAVGGCVASQEGEAIIERAPFVDIVFGPQTLHRLPKLISSYCGSNQPIVDVSFPEHEKFVSGLLETKINDITKEIIENKVSKDIWLLFIMAPYIFLNRDDNHFIPLFETTKMVANAEENIVDNWSV